MSNKIPRDDKTIAKYKDIYIKDSLKYLEDLFSKYIDRKDAKKMVANTSKYMNQILYEKYVPKKMYSVKGRNVYYDDAEHIEYKYWRYTVLMVLMYQSFGDTLGYYNGRWEFNHGNVNAGPEDANEKIYEFISLGGINDISLYNWRASDDTILYMATFKVLLKKHDSMDSFGKDLRTAYLEALPSLENRHPGVTTMRSLNIQQNIKWDKLPYNSMDIGNGACMRSGCVGIFFPGTHNRARLIAYATEVSRITHNSAIGILSSITTALFTAYALEKKPINHWPHKLMKILKSTDIDDYIKESRPNEYNLFMRDKVIYVGQWEKYLSLRFSGLTPRLDIQHMKNPVKRIKYLAENFSKGHMNFPGGTGDDCVIIAYDALLESGDVLEKLVFYSVLHHGDSDTVGSIAFSWFAGLYHTSRHNEIMVDRFEDLEFFEEILQLYDDMFEDSLKIFYKDIYIYFSQYYIRKNSKKTII